MSGRRTVAVTLNGRERTFGCEPRRLLSDALRHDLGATGTNVGCEQGSCGACTIIVDGRAQRSCLMLAVQADGAAIETIEGAGEGTAGGDGEHPVQRAMHAEHGLQCGFCTPGIVMSLVHAQRSGASLDQTIDDVLNGHICRCTGYVNIRRAIAAAWSDLDNGHG